MTVPNILTVIRILLTPLLVWLLLDGRMSSALCVFFVAGVTDGLDGFIARTFNQKSRLGTYLDPLADKLLLDTTFILLAYLHIIPTWLTIIVVSRDAIIVLGVFLFFLNHIYFEVKPSLPSKLTTLSQILTALVALSSSLWNPHWFLLSFIFTVTAIFTIVSGLHYIYHGFRIWESERVED
ncbi:MAG: CDP-alcohol phosphatidyltransferase family protein [Deltaproteobacteria bacterium]|nr:CDP-alcohol phosphatidyltransferase family protein [Deltaproteobacteria bacterium]MBW2068566.1 CDP-alcohol phosphatidyltransferase family protein [Deltaproteobacteria bacterium]